VDPQENKRLREELDTMTADRDRLQTCLAEDGKEKERLIGKIKKYYQGKKYDRQQMQNALTGLAERVLDLLNQEPASPTQLEQELEKTKKELEESTGALNRLRDELDVFTRELRECERHRGHQEMEAKSQRETIENLHNTLSQVTGERDAIVRAAKVVEITLKRLEAERDGAIQEQSRLHAQVVHLEAQNKQLIDQLQAQVPGVNDTHHQDLQLLTQALERVQQELSQAQQQVVENLGLYNKEKALAAAAKREYEKTLEFREDLNHGLLEQLKLVDNRSTEWWRDQALEAKKKLEEYPLVAEAYTAIQRAVGWWSYLERSQKRSCEAAMKILDQFTSFFDGGFKCEAVRAWLEEQRLEAASLHPDGKCTCGGEGTCEWCQKHCLQCGQPKGDG
jgi:chromosome segregation ATPase